MVREMVIGQKHFALAVSRMPTPNTVWHPHSGVIVARRRSQSVSQSPRKKSSIISSQESAVSSDSGLALLNIIDSWLSLCFLSK